MEWQPIETYDKLRKKPKYAVFYIAATKKKYRSDLNLPEVISDKRQYGRRETTHWMPLPDPPKE